MTLLISIGFGVSIMLFVMALINKSPAPIDKLNAYDDAQIVAAQVEKGKMGPIARMALHLPSFMFGTDHRIAKMIQLKQADIPFSVEEFFIIKMMILTSVPFLMFSINQNPLIIPIGVLLTEVLIRLMIKGRIQKKVKAFDRELNEGIVMISNALKAGYSFLQALAVAAAETQDPLSKEFKQMLKEMSLGIQMGDALMGLASRTASEDLKLLVNAILIQKDIGGNLSEILENIGETIRERQSIKNEVKTLTAQGKMSGGIIMAMPVFIGVIVYIFNPNYISILFTTELGRIMVGLAVMNQLIGWIFIKNIIKVEL